MERLEKTLSDIHYDEQWDVVDTYDNTFGRDSLVKLLTKEEIEAVAAYYYVNHKTTDIYRHRREIESFNPRLVKLAKQAALKVARHTGVNLKSMGLSVGGGRAKH